MKKSLVFCLVLPLFISLFPLQAQTTSSGSSGDSSMVSSQFDMTGFPQWSKDARRFEIVTFGSFPFAYFFTNFGFDTYRCAINGWNTSYAPWPFTGPAAVGKSQSENFLTIGLSVGTAVTIALVDLCIELYKRNRKEEENRNLPEGTPIIIRKPLEDAGSGTGTGTGSTTDQGDTGSP